MAYTQDEKSTGLDELTPIEAGDLIVIGDVSDGGNAKVITVEAFTTYIGGLDIVAASAYLNSAQTVTQDVDTKILFDTEIFDTNDNFATSRFTATVAGYYQVNAACQYISPTEDAVNYFIFIEKNGIKVGESSVVSGGTAAVSASISNIIFLDVADYIEVFTAHDSSGSQDLHSGFASTNFISVAKL